MRKCDRCGKEYFGNEQFCTECGQKLFFSAHTPPSDSLKELMRETEELKMRVQVKRAKERTLSTDAETPSAFPLQLPGSTDQSDPVRITGNGNRQMGFGDLSFEEKVTEKKDLKLVPTSRTIERARPGRMILFLIFTLIETFAVFLALVSHTGSFVSVFEAEKYVLKAFFNLPVECELFMNYIATMSETETEAMKILGALSCAGTLLSVITVVLSMLTLFYHASVKRIFLFVSVLLSVLLVVENMFIYFVLGVNMVGFGLAVQVTASLITLLMIIGNYNKQKIKL